MSIAYRLLHGEGEWGEKGEGEVRVEAKGISMKFWEGCFQGTLLSYL